MGEKWEKFNGYLHKYYYFRSRFITTPLLVFALIYAILIIILPPLPLLSFFIIAFIVSICVTTPILYLISKILKEKKALNDDIEKTFGKKLR